MVTNLKAVHVTDSKGRELRRTMAGRFTSAIPTPKHRQCSATTKAGKRCRCPRVGATDLCMAHTPEIANAARRKGGRAHQRYPSVDFAPGPTTPQESMRMLSQMMAEVRAGQLDPMIATAARGLHVAFLKAYEDSYIVDQLAKLEERLGLEVALTLPEEQVPSEIA
jgi:hypothetical protein